MKNAQTSIMGVGSCALAKQQGELSERATLKHRYDIECVGPDGKVKWTDTIDNLIVDEGLNDILDKAWAASGYTADFYVGLTDGTPTAAAGDVMNSHAGWVEVVAYGEATRPALSLGAVSAQSVDNSASKASYSINGTATVGGAFIVSNSAKSGTTGILRGVGPFSGGDKPVANGDTLNVTTTLTAAG